VQASEKILPSGKEKEPKVVGSIHPTGKWTGGYEGPVDKIMEVA
jgi:hypothetical protein